MPIAGKEHPVYLTELLCDAMSMTEPTILPAVRILRTQENHGDVHDNVRSELECNNKDATSVHSLCLPAGRDAEETGHDIRRNRHQLCDLRVGVTEILDDGGQEQRIRVKSGGHANGDEHAHPYLPVAHCRPEVLQSKLVCKRGPITFETCQNFCPLWLRQEAGRGRVVFHDEQGDDG
jgi:hypothetical protein